MRSRIPIRSHTTIRVRNRTYDWHCYILDSKSVVCHVKTSQRDGSYVAFRKAGVKNFSREVSKKPLSPSEHESQLIVLEMICWWIHSSNFALVVASTAGTVLECSARITKGVDSVYVFDFSVDHRAVQCGVGFSSVEVQLVGLASNQRPATQCSDDYSLLDWRDLVDGTVCKSKGNE